MSDGLRIGDDMMRKEMDEWEEHYRKCCKELLDLIPASEVNKILRQYYCELDYEFLGFVNIYKPLSELIPKQHIVIDFGCYLAAQSYFFQNHKQYIGVDGVELNRFKTENTEHYVGSIQEYIEQEVPKFLTKDNNLNYFAICSYVPDDEATELVRKTFQNVCCYYPCR